MKLVISLMVFLLVGCAGSSSETVVVTQPAECTVQVGDVSTVISCTDGTEVEVDNPDEPDVTQPACSLTPVEGSVVITCDDGTTVTLPVETDEDNGQECRKHAKKGYKCKRDSKRDD